MNRGFENFWVAEGRYIIDDLKALDEEQFGNMRPSNFGQAIKIAMEKAYEKGQEDNNGNSD